MRDLSRNGAATAGPAPADGALSRLSWRWRQRLSARLIADRARWVLWLPVGVGGGVALYFSLALEPPAWWGWLATGLAAAATAWFRANPGRRALAAAVFAVAIGFSAAKARTDWAGSPTLRAVLGPVAIEAQVLESQPVAGGARVILHRLRITGLEADLTPQRVRVRLKGWDRLEGLEPEDSLGGIGGTAAANGAVNEARAGIRASVPPPGSWIRLRAKLHPPSAPVAPGGFDFQRRAYFQGIGAGGFAFGRARQIPPPEGADVGAPGWRLALERLRSGVGERLRAGLDGAAGAVAVALATGQRDAIPDDVLQAMRDSGLAHLLAISGLHIGLVAGILLVSLRLLLAAVPSLALRLSVKKCAAIGAWIGALGYLALAGAPVPTQRAVMMTGVVLLAILVDRRAISMRLVAWAALAVLLIQPESLLGPSFQMSFAAVIGLVAAYERARTPLASLRMGRTSAGAPGWWRVAATYLLALALTSLVAAVATAPFAIYHFNRLALFGLAANLAAVPIVAFVVMPSLLAALALMPFGYEGLALVPLGWGIDAMLAVARTVAAWPGAAALLPAWSIGGLASVALGGLWICLWQQRWRWWGMAPIALGLAAGLVATPPDLLVSEDGRLLAVRDGTGQLRVSSGRAGRFVADAWLRQAGQAAAALWPEESAGAIDDLACDKLGCVLVRPNIVVALVRDARALAEDCRRADLVIATVPVRRKCSSARRVIDRFDLWRQGGHAIWLQEDGKFRVETVAGSRGVRPWVITPTSRKQR